MDLDADSLAKTGAGAGAGATILLFAVRMITGSAFKEVQMRTEAIEKELEGHRNDIKEALIALRADMKERIDSLKDMIERSDRRHDQHIQEAAIVKKQAEAAHQRLDQIENRITALERKRR